MQAGFHKVDITPRVGVELCGFGPYLQRRSIAVRDRLWARAMALRAGGRTAVVVSNDLVGVNLDLTERVRAAVGAASGLPPDAILIHCTHTHSGPNTDRQLYGWGVLDEPYLETLPGRLIAACLGALERLQDATLSHAEVPCEGIGLNREYDRDAPPLEEVLRDDWRPAHPERTDTTCHVLKLAAGDRVLGFAGYFACHPVVCCEDTRLIHGDYPGVATNWIEREHPGAVGLFLQGAHGDVNTCVVHKPEAQALPALDVVAGRYARALRRGLVKATPVEVEDLRYVRRSAVFTRAPLTETDLQSRLAKQEAILHSSEASDESREVRMATVYALALRRVLARVQAGEPVEEPTELQGVRLGPFALLGSPFETFQEIKNEVRSRACAPIPLVMSLCNDGQGYATDRTIAARGGYAAEMVPLMKGSLPFRNIHTELVAALLDLDKALGAPDTREGDSPHD